MFLDIKKSYTENPFIDSLLYCIKILSFGCILKSEEQATKYETLDSIKNAEEYIYALEDGSQFEIFRYTTDILSKSSVPADKITYYANDNTLIPEQYHEELTAIAKQYILDNYEELNDYYRMINGKPPLDDHGIPIGPYLYLLPTDEDLNEYTYAHEVNLDIAKMFESYGVIDAMKLDYPNAEYLDYLTKDISIYTARKSVDKQILYLPSTGLPDIDDLFRSKYEINRNYVRSNVSSTAMEYSSENYQAFLCTFILFLTMLDMMAELQDHIIKKDILDARCIEYIFNMHGLPYYSNIPLKYQIIMCKNVNNLLQYKSSAQDMFNFLTYFGADDINIMKYYLLRDRKLDTWGNFKFTKATEVLSNQNTIIKHERFTRPISDNIIPMPFDYILSKGNKLYVWVNDVKLIEDLDYELYNYDKIRFITSFSEDSIITYDFYYDESTRYKEFEADTDHGINMSYQQITSVPANGIIKLQLPITKYFVDGNDIIVCVGSSILHPDHYILDIRKNELMIDSSFKASNKAITIIYLYGNKTATYFETHRVTATNNNQTRFTIPEPFTNYITNGNAFFVTLGNTFISSDRYRVENDSSIVFTDGTTILEGRDIVFHFPYSQDSIYTQLGIMHTSIKFTATSYFQTVFDGIEYPINNYLSKGFKVYVKLRGWYLDSNYYDVYVNTLTLIDQSIALYKGEEIEIHFYYSPFSVNTAVATDIILANDIFQQKFQISYPIENFFEKGNKIIIDVAGYPLQEEIDYILEDNNTVINIINPDFRPYKNQRVGIIYVYNKETYNSIRMHQQHIIVESDNQNTFYLNFPFYPYLETGQGYIIMHNSVIIHPELITINQYNLTIDRNNIKAGDALDILYIYNNRYLTEKLSLLKIREVTLDRASNMAEYNMMPIPVPFEDYIEHDWCYFIDSNKNKIDEARYEAVDNQLIFINAAEINNYETFTFTFIYKDQEPWIYETSTEDFLADLNLIFLKISLKDTTLDTKGSEHVKRKEYIKTYESMTNNDPFWDGEIQTRETHLALKKRVLKQEFNYARTKYMSVDYLKDITETSFQIVYFYNMLFDDVFKEEKLNIQLPFLVPYHQFKISHIFCYMIALNYIFKGVEDTIMTKPSHILYVKGFNFRASLNKIRQYILNCRRIPEDFYVYDFKIPVDQIPDLNEFIDILNTNKDIYKRVKHNMAVARNYDIYSIWKMIYDSLMIYEFNLEFFKLSDGEVANTFTEFLKEKDIILYDSLIKIKAIDDDNTRAETIIQTMEDIIYILDEYIDSDEFNYIYSNFPGISKEYLLEYLFTMINFFKSYKILLNNMYIVFNIGDPDTNYIKPNDVQSMQTKLNKLDYNSIRESKGSTISLNKQNSIKTREHIQITYSYKNQD